MKVIWSKKAIGDYYSIIDYLIVKWSASSAEKFIDQVYSKIHFIKTHPEAFEKTNFEGSSRVVITKQVTLFFRVYKTKIYLLRFWNNSRNPEKLRL
ncbi:type II toxin-antitoxin system RelE/ParE family toxin [Algoriphagus sp.]|uniref:type II toxin-antitoxin system RelE/ParE family toxin n=1 Tax=Algoriphagus sp. TaxID=1872435 RepID=UPI00391CE789